MAETAVTIESQGTIFAINTGTTLVPIWTTIGGIKDFSGFGGSASVIDTTTLASEAKEKRMGLQDWGQFSINFNHDDTDDGQAALIEAKSTRELQGLKLTLSDDTTYSFSGYVTSKPINGGVDTVVTGSATIEISGDVTTA